MRRVKAALAAAAALAASSCASTGPEPAPPAIGIPAAYKEAQGWQPAGANVAEAGRWWALFRDPTLSGLEERVEAGNPNLAAAAARYAQAQGLVGQARADRFPQVALSADASRQRVSAGRPGSPGTAATYNNLSLGAALDYELDLFGRVRNSVRASEAAAQASVSDVAAVRLGLQAQLASAYFDLRGLDARTLLLRQTVAAYQRAFDLTATRHEGGIASGIDVSRARNLLGSARAELSSVAIARQRDEHAIAILIGEAPAGFSLPLEAGMIAPPSVPAGLPSALLERRPDIAAAERRVAEANARIGVARAALFPAISLGGAGGFQAAGVGLLSASNAFWALGPLSAALSIFDGGRRRAGVRIARAQYDETVANYRETVLTAFREVEDDLAGQRLLASQERDQADAAAGATRTRDLALIRYHDGAADYLEVVIAQTASLDAERSLLEVRTQRLTTAVDTIRALGGTY
ncbi:MAG: transporter [Alphaproteobacteria bacterium]|nr:transporter [Alphaproteobacteria bacterium]